MLFTLNPGEQAAHPNPYVSVRLQVEFRSPRHRTFLLPAFFNGDNVMVVRFSPLDAGEWEYKVSSNIKRFENQAGKLTATEAPSTGFLIPANGHHWRYTEGQTAHLWMGDTSYALAFLEDADFRLTVDTRAAQKFNHIRAYATGREGYYQGSTFRDADHPDIAFFKRLDDRIAYSNSKGVTLDLILGHGAGHLSRLFPTAAERERFLRFMIARYSSFDITWQLMQEWETYPDGRALGSQMGLYLKNNDPYRHPRSTHTVATAGPLFSDGWMDHILYQSEDMQLGAIEHQLYPAPAVNAGFGYENSGAGAESSSHVPSDEFRKRLWNSFMNGQYPTFGNTGTYGAGKRAVDTKYLESPGARAMTVWYELIARTRHWELEPYFDLDGGRAMALPGVEYIVYAEKPAGPVEVRLEKHEYDVRWMDPATGEVTPLKQFKSDKFAGEPPNREHDWVLHISRDRHKEGMLRSWKFESRPFLMQEPESATTKVPFEIAEPASGDVSVANSPGYSVKLRRDTRGTRSMLYLWTGDVPVDQAGYRVLGTGPEGKWKLDPHVLRTSPGVMNVRLYGMNANGKVYLTDKIFTVTK
ncbi:MAG: DUF4038 domain-containing protein [Bryobacteraceae bacterium]|nr:DUF4038 domain-containing protein [Bryobacteraceae bacterium]